jgi:hypothetical protein
MQRRVPSYTPYRTDNTETPCRYRKRTLTSRRTPSRKPSPNSDRFGSRQKVLSIDCFGSQSRTPGSWSSASSCQHYEASHTQYQQQPPAKEIGIIGMAGRLLCNHSVGICAFSCLHLADFSFSLYFSTFSISTFPAQYRRGH